MPEPKLGWGPFVAAKLLEIAAGLVGLMVLFAVLPTSYVPSTAASGILPLLGGAIFISVIYFVFCGYLAASALAFWAGKTVTNRTDRMSILMAAVFGIHAAVVAIWAGHYPASFYAFIATMSVISFLIHQFAFRKLA